LRGFYKVRIAIMENMMFWFVVCLAAITLYRLLSRRASTPKARVTAMLRRYRALERSGLSEQECLLQLLATRADWNKLPHRFLAELVSRLRSKEDVMRFVSVSEDYGYPRGSYPEIARKIDLDAAMSEIACLFSHFGFRLQAEARYREAEFVQKLALQLQPDQYFTNLPLAATYHETGRHDEALPLFEQGLARFQDFENNAKAAEQALSPVRCLGPDVEVGKLRNRYRKMYEACLKATERKSLTGFCLWVSMKLLC
jgi:tetratricopeptide (TPR) repeat protein